MRGASCGRPQTSMISASFFPAISSTFSMPLSITSCTFFAPFLLIVLGDLARRFDTP